MKNQPARRAIATLLFLASAPVLAVEAPKPAITLFNDNVQVFIAGTDISANPGIETVGLTAAITTQGVSNPDKVRSRLKTRLKVKSSANNSGLGTFLPYVDTKAYPNPSTTVGTAYYCEEDGGEVVNVDPTTEGFPCDFNLNMGIANSGQTRYLVMGLAMFAWYENEADGTVDVGQASVTIFDAASYSKSWRKTWKVTAGDWELKDNLSAVGDFLNDDGVDEVRIAYSRDLPNDATEMKYTYYDIATGSEIKEDTYTVAAP